jgi:competence protein ComEA
MKNELMTLLTGLMLSTSAMAAVDLNTATQSELESVKGIGPAKAERIVEYRRKHGAFKNLDALASVKGFGRASVAKLKNELVLGANQKPVGKK